MKICFVIEGMYNSGGMERVLSTIANGLNETMDISILTIYQNGRPFFFPIRKSVKHDDLGMLNISNKSILKQKLTAFFLENLFDVIISLGGIDMYYLPSIPDKSKKVVWFHFAYDFFITGKKGIYKIKGYAKHLRRLYFARKFHRIIAISHTDALLWEKYVGPTILIPNPITINTNATSDLQSKSVISVGRLDAQKGYQYLIKAWEYVAKTHPEWKLDIYGEGYMREQLQELINSLKLNNVVTLCGTTNDVISKYCSHSIFVMSSITECFPLVLLEASSCGLPLIAFDCKSGPRDIVTDGENGFLVHQVGDVDTLAHRIIYLIEDENKRYEYGRKAKLMSQRFSSENVSNKWHVFLNSLLNE